MKLPGAEVASHAMRRGVEACSSDVLVIGAGMAGLTAARQLIRQGLSVTVVEGRDRTGGRVHTVRDFAGLPVEAGAEFVHTADAETWPEIRAAHLAVRKCALTRRSMFNLGGRTRWLPWLLLHPESWAVFSIMRQLARANSPEMSARDFIERQGYRGRARMLAEMVFTAHLPGMADEIGVLGLLEDRVLHLLNGSFHRITDGYDRLVDHIARGLDVRRQFPVATVEWGPDGVTVTAEDGRALSARAAITTLPPGVLASGAVHFEPSLPESKRRAFADLVMGPVMKLLLHFSEPFWPAWLANLTCATGPVTLYWPAGDGDRHAPAVLTAYCTGPRATRLARLPEDEAVAVALADLARLFPRADPGRLLLGHRRIDWTADPFSRGGYTFTRPGSPGGPGPPGGARYGGAVLGRRRHGRLDGRRHGAGGVRQRPAGGVGGAELPGDRQHRRRPGRLGRKRFAEPGQAQGPFAIACAALHRLFDRGERLGAVDVADGARGGAGGHRVRGGLEQIGQHLRVAPGGRIDVVGPDVPLDRVAVPVEVGVGVPEQEPGARVARIAVRELVHRGQRALGEVSALVETVADRAQGARHGRLPRIAGARAGPPLFLRLLRRLHLRWRFLLGAGRLRGRRDRRGRLRWRRRGRLRGRR